jgi:hypothetical protein
MGNDIMNLDIFKKPARAQAFAELDIARETGAEATA